MKKKSARAAGAVNFEMVALVGTVALACSLAAYSFAHSLVQMNCNNMEFDNNHDLSGSEWVMADQNRPEIGCAKQSTISTVGCPLWQPNCNTSS